MMSIFAPPCVLCLFALVSLAPPAAAGDRVVLKDGQILTGTIVDENASEIRIRIDGVADPFVIPRSVVAEVAREPKRDEDPKAAPTGALANGPATVRLLQGGRELEGTIVNIDATSLTLAVGDREYTLDKSRLEWVRQGGATHRFGSASPTGEAPRGGPPRRGGDDGAAPSAELRAWLDTCAKHLASADPAVRRSAGGALMAAGPAGRATLEAAARSDDAGVAATARRLLDQGGPAGRGGGRGGRFASGAGSYERIFAELGLSEEQRAQTDTAVAEWNEARARLMEARREGTLEREELGARFLEINGTLRERLGKILNDEQRAKWEEMNRGRNR